MKKRYMNPLIEVIKIETHKMLAESMGQLDNPVTDPLSHEDDNDW